MKKLINSVFRYFGWTPPFGKKTTTPKEPVKNAAKTNEFLVAWCRSALKTINEELSRQIMKNGFDADKIRTGELILTREESADAEGNKYETYYIGNIEIMRVNWKVNGFSISVRPREGQREVKKIATKLEQQLITTATKDDIEINAKAAQMVKDFEQTPAPDLTGPNAGKIIKLPTH